jgi:glutamine synthetase
MDKNDKLVYVIEKDSHTQDSLKKILSEHKEIKFVSLLGVDLIGHETDEMVSLYRQMAHQFTFLQ